uniref:Uncharacterized protein n=2 Tax=Nicotiana TaxID=4085 RepID=A0A1S3XEZ4_TOBAC|nr:PREDICTED: uncharacterized protein LOC104221905 [Nicotiana sylvestris]XP_016438435.1 PREDICTED: uncharacterized protein LOC107764387 [Nicotiana tabacum]
MDEFKADLIPNECNTFHGLTCYMQKFTRVGTAVGDTLRFHSYNDPYEGAYLTDKMWLQDNFSTHIFWFETQQSLKVSKFPLVLLEIILTDTHMYIKMSWLDKGSRMFNKMIGRNLLTALVSPVPLVASYNSLMMCMRVFGSLVPWTDIYVKPHVIEHVEALLLVFSCAGITDPWWMIPGLVSGDYMVKYRAMYFKYCRIPGIHEMTRLACIEKAKVADLIAFVASTSSNEEGCYIDASGSHCVHVFRALGLSSTIGLICDLPSELLALLLNLQKIASFIQHIE